MADKTRAVNLQAVAIGFLAEAVLQQEGILHSIAVFERSMYIEDSGNRILCLLRDDLPQGPLHILCAGWPPAMNKLLKPQEQIVYTHKRLQTTVLQVDLSGAKVWIPETINLTASLRRETVRQQFDLVGKTAPPETLLYQIVNRDKPDSSRQLLETALLEEVKKGLAALRSWLAKPETPFAPPIAGLIGLGPGLTPSGDDILAGGFSCFVQYAQNRSSVTTFGAYRQGIAATHQ